jgi:putative SOS response-associated peptidase YedK
MCGRFSQSIEAAAIAQTFQVESIALSPNYNVAPSQSVAAIIRFPAAPQRQLYRLRWGLIPSWAKDPAIGFKTINARSETAAEKPSFRAAFQQRRCLIPAAGFYEWRRIAGSKTNKQPYFIQVSGDHPCAFAGLYERWQSPAGEILETCTILTTTANDLVAPIHDRMPVILHPQDYDLWLDPNFHQIDRLQALLQPYPTAQMSAYPVSTIVNSPKNNNPECQQPI